MKPFFISRKAARLVVLQRIELIGPILTKIRKLFGRYLFSSFITKYFLKPNFVGQKYYKIMFNEFLTIKRFIEPGDNYFLSIGGGMGGLELIINEKFKDKKFYFIEKNYVSKKVKYGWGGMINDEAYNDLILQKDFLERNNMDHNQIYQFDYDQDKLPDVKFDVIISLLSLDYHYDFNLYKDYLKTVSKPNTKIIFDTIRADHFKEIFKNVEVIRFDANTVHKSKRIICNQFLD